MAKRIIRLTESEFTNLIKRVIKEAKLARTNMADIMSLQDYILQHEIESGTAGFVPENPVGCKVPRNTVYNPGESTNNQCLLTGSTLCDGPCYQSTAVDGIYGALTQSAYETYKDIEVEIDDGSKITLEDNFGSDDYSTSERWGGASTANWQIPANMENIKAFQWWVWNNEENKQKEDPNCTEDCSETSILCGGDYCTYDEAVDGYWGTNTKKAWEQYKEAYYDDGNDVTSYRE